MKSNPSPEERYRSLAKALAVIPGVTLPSADDQEKGRFGSNGAKVRGKIFAMLARGRLVVKIPKSRVDELVSLGEGVRFDPRRDGRLMKEWLMLNPVSKVDWLAISKEAMEFVSSEKNS